MQTNPSSFGRLPARHRKETNSSVSINDSDLATPLEFFFRLHYEQQSDAAQLAMQFRRFVFYLAYRYGLGDPEDFLSDVLLELFVIESRHRYNPSRSAYFWYVWHVARNKAINLFKMFQKRRLKLEKLLPPPVPDTDAISELGDLISRLNPIYRDALILYFYEGLSDKEAALRLGVSCAALRQRRKRALDELESLCSQQ